MDPLMLSGCSSYASSTLNNDLMMAPFLNQYQNMVSAQDSLSMLNSDMMSMNGSIIPSFSGTIDYDSFYNNMQSLQQNMANNQIRQNQNWRHVSFQSNSPYEAIQKQVKSLHTKIIENEQEQIMKAFEALKVAVRQAYDPNGEATDEQISARAEQEYRNLYGKDLVEDIKMYGNGSFEQGFWQSCTFGFADGVTADENVAKITGQPVGRKQSFWKKFGNGVGGAVVGAAGLGLLTKLVSLTKLFKGKWAIGALIGGIIGAIAGPALSQSHS